ncbi:hypothetical protein J6590_042313 [Homalodisca vitripennis]|nr:hypothetical protein J6590_042313 [Homalodisca vitripennis]
MEIDGFSRTRPQFPEEKLSTAQRGFGGTGEQNNNRKQNAYSTRAVDSYAERENAERTIETEH